MSAPIKSRESIPVIETGGGGRTPSKGKSKVLPVILVLVVIAIVAVIAVSVQKKGSNVEPTATTAQATNPAVGGESQESPGSAKGEEAAPKAAATEIGVPVVNEGTSPITSLRAALEATGWSVTWVHEDKLAVSQKNGTQIKVRPGTGTIEAGETTVNAAPAPVLREGRIFLPVEALESATGGQIKYDKASGQLLSESAASN